MAEFLIQDSTLVEIADSIRAKTKKTDEIFVSNFADEIADISTGVELNFEIVGGTTQPENPTENMIWVDTDMEIAGWYIAPEQPTNMVDGEVWICADQAGAISFNALKENNIMVYPITAKQMVSGTLTDKDAMCYNDGEWVEFYKGINIYHNGSFETGYEIKTRNSDSDYGTVSFTPNGDYIQLNSSGDIYAMYYISPLVTRGNFTTLNIAFENASMSIDSGGTAMFGLSSNTSPKSPSFVSAITFTSFSGSKTLSVDISNVSSTTEYYIALRFGLSNKNFSARIKRIWLDYGG